MTAQGHSQPTGQYSLLWPCGGSASPTKAISYNTGLTSGWVYWGWERNSLQSLNISTGGHVRILSQAPWIQCRLAYIYDYLFLWLAYTTLWHLTTLCSLLVICSLPDIQSTWPSEWFWPRTPRLLLWLKLRSWPAARPYRNNLSHMTLAVPLTAAEHHKCSWVLLKSPTPAIQDRSDGSSRYRSFHSFSTSQVECRDALAFNIKLFLENKQRFNNECAIVERVVLWTKKLISKFS